MFFRQKRSGKHTYLQIVENRWENGRSKQRVIATLGRLDELREIQDKYIKPALGDLELHQVKTHHIMAAVQSIAKITRAQELIASSRIVRAQQQMRAAEARAVFERLLSVVPDNAMGLRGLGQVNAMSGEMDQAIARCAPDRPCGVDEVDAGAFGDVAHGVPERAGADAVAGLVANPARKTVTARKPVARRTLTSRATVAGPAPAAAPAASRERASAASCWGCSFRSPPSCWRPCW